MRLRMVTFLKSSLHGFNHTILLHCLTREDGTHICPEKQTPAYDALRTQKREDNYTLAKAWNLA
jgi:hypothetical protein